MKTYKDYNITESIADDFTKLFKKYKGWTNGSDWFIPFLKKDGVEYVMEINLEKNFYNRGNKIDVWEIGEVLYKDGRTWQNYYYDRGKVLATRIRIPANETEALKGMEEGLKYITTKGSLDKLFIEKLERLLSRWTV